MSQQDLAEAAQTTRRTIGAIERGESAPQPRTLERVRQVLGLDDPESFDPEVETYLSIIGPLLQQVPAEQRALVLRRMILVLSQALGGPGAAPQDATENPFGLATTVDRRVPTEGTDGVM